MIGRGPRALVDSLLRLALPAVCAICQRPHEPQSERDESIVCGLCLSRVVSLAEPLCERCGHPRLSGTVPLPPARPAGTGPLGATIVPSLPPCRWCPRLHPAIRAVRSAGRMDQGTAAELVHALKYQGWSAAARPMARCMARVSWPIDVREERTALIPIPLSRIRARERGYNQAGLLAAELAAHWGIPCWDDMLERTRHTASQVRLTPSDRAGNVSHAFGVPHGRRGRLRGRHVVLVDDVVTTAATLNAAAEALLEGGARILSCVTFGRAPDPGDRAAPDYDFIRI